MALTKVTGGVVSPSSDYAINNVTGVAATFTGNVSIGGTLTYQDVSNIDAVGIITAQAGIHLGIGATTGKIDVATGISTFTKVGIGVTNPNNPLTIHGSGNHIYLKDTATNNILQIRHANGVAEFNSFDLDGNARRDYVFNQYATEVLRITSGGDVGVGNDSPNCRLAVKDTTDALTAYANVTPSVGDCMAQLYYNPSSETVNDHATLQFGINGGSHNRVNTISAVAESATNRKLAFTFCTDSGSNRNERMRISGDGNVGIGITNPYYDLDITNGGVARVAVDVTTGSDAIIWMDGINADFAGSDYWGLAAQSSGEFAILKASSEKLRITSGGIINCGHGTETNLHGKTTTGVNINGNGNSGQIIANASGNRALIIGRQSSYGQVIEFFQGTNLNEAAITIPAADSFGIETAGTERLRIASTGRVAIGNATNNASPTALLGVIADDGEAANLYIAKFHNLEATTGESFGVNIQAGSSADDHGLRVKNRANSVTQFIVRGDGHIGIGIDAPTSKLYVNGVSTSPVITARTADDNGESVINILSEGTTGYSRIKFSDTAGIDGQISYTHTDRAITFHTAGTTEKVRFASDGNVGVGITNPTFSAINSISAGAVRGIEIFRDGTDTGTALRLAGDNGSGTKAWSQLGYSGANGTAHWANYNTAGALQGEILIGPTGNIGIGNRTTSPDADLHVHTSSGESTIHIEAATNANLNLRSHSGDSTVKFSDGSASNVGNINYDHGTDSLSVRVNASPRLKITSTGDVLINQPAEDSGRLTIKGTNSSGSTCYAVTNSGKAKEGIDITCTTVGSGNYGGGISFGCGGNGRSAIAAIQTGSDDDRNGLSFFTHGSSTGANDTTERLRIDAYGSLNIGSRLDQTDDLLHVNSFEMNKEAIGIGASSQGIRLGWKGDNSAYDSSRIYRTDYSTSEQFGMGASWPCMVITPTTAPGSGVSNETLWLKSTGSGSGSTSMHLTVDGTTVIGGNGKVNGGTTSGYPNSRRAGLGDSKLTIQPNDRTSAFAAATGSTWHDVVIKQSGSASNNAVGIAFEVSTAAYHHNAGTGIAAVKNGTNSDYGSHLVFITRPQSAVARDRLRINHNGLITATRGNGCIDGTYVYKQQNQSSNYEHKIRGPLGGLIDTEMNTNSVAYIKVQCLGTGTNTAYCYYRWSQDGENLGATLTHIHGNSGSSSNNPWMVLDGQHPCWKTAHSTAYEYVVRVEITGGEYDLTFQSTANGDYGGTYTSNP